jgi:hypothetical protein
MLGFLNTPGSNPQHTSTILFTSPVEFSTFARISVTTPSADADDQQAASVDVVGVLSSATQLQAAGGQYVAWASSGAAAQVVCHKGLAGRLFKALQLNQGALGIKMGDLRSSVTLGLMPPDQLLQAVELAVSRSLAQAGWRRLAPGTWLSTDVLSATQPQAAMEVGIHFQTQLPAQILVHVELASKLIASQQDPRCMW